MEKKLLAGDNDIQNQRARIINGKLEVCFAGTWRTVEISDYENLKVINQGANAVTISGINKSTRRKDCIKIYTPNANSPTKQVNVQQYLKEVQKLASIKDPRIVTVYSAFDVSKDVHVVTMEYIDGITLREWLKDKTGSDDEQNYILRLNVVKVILETVLAYQKKGVLHGDLHTKNILIGRDNSIHIIDFGTSYLGGQTKTLARENYLVFDLVRQMLGKSFDENVFSVRCPRKWNDPDLHLDVRRQTPVLLTQTLLAYANAKDEFLQVDANAVARDVRKICVTLSEGICFDFDALSDYIAKENNVDANWVKESLYSEIDYRISPDDRIEDSAFFNELKEDQLEVYYQLTLKSVKAWNNDLILDTLSSTQNVYSIEECKKIIDTLLLSSLKTYRSLASEDEDDIYRLVMGTALMAYYGESTFIGKYWEGVSERRALREMS